MGSQRVQELEIEIDGIFGTMLLLKKKKYAALTVHEDPSYPKGYSTGRYKFCHCQLKRAFILLLLLFCESCHSYFGIMSPSVSIASY